MSGGDGGRAPDLPMRLWSPNMRHVSGQDRAEHVSHVPGRIHRAGHGHGKTGGSSAQTSMRFLVSLMTIYYKRLKFYTIIIHLKPFEFVNEGGAILNIERDINPGSNDRIDPG